MRHIEITRGRKIHSRVGKPGRPRCGTTPYVHTTSRKESVDCKNCLKILKAEEERRNRWLGKNT